MNSTHASTVTLAGCRSAEVIWSGVKPNGSRWARITTADSLSAGAGAGAGADAGAGAGTGAGAGASPPGLSH